MRFFCAAILELWALSSAAQTTLNGNVVIGFAPASVVGGTNITCDSWCDFEFTATPGNVTPTLLNGATHGTALTWSGHGTLTGISTSTSGEQKVIDNPRGTVDTGTRGLTVNTVGNVQASFGAAFPSAQSSVSSAVWMFAPTMSADSGIDAIQFDDSGGTFHALASFRRSSGSYSFRFTCTGSSIDVPISVQNVWYWVTLKFVTSGAVSMAIYDSTGMKVGSTATGTDTSGVQVTNVRVGPDNTYSAITAVNAYYDDLLVNWTTAAFPLGP